MSLGTRLLLKNGTVRHVGWVGSSVSGTNFDVPNVLNCSKICQSLPKCVVNKRDFVKTPRGRLSVLRGRLSVLRGRLSVSRGAHVLYT